MRSIPSTLCFLMLVVATRAGAHPGHSHSDVPALIRHPFAGPAHLLGSATVGLALAGAIYAVTRRVQMPVFVRWTGLSVVAIAVAVGLSI